MRKVWTKERFINEANALHNYKYSYDNSDFVNMTTSIQIQCPIHGVIHQLPKQHLKSSGCIKCGRAIQASKRRKTLQEFIKQADKVHNKLYDYTKVTYVNDSIDVSIICPEHGEFEQAPGSHLVGRKCPQCALKQRAQKRIYSFEHFKEKAEEVHGNEFTYDPTTYTMYSDTTKIRCNTCNTTFETTPIHHVREGTKCPKCTGRGFDKTKPTYLYYLKITTEEGQVLYKIGITNKTVNERFPLKDLAKIEVVKQKLYVKGTDAINWETKLKRKYKEFQYKGPDILSSGNTELFTEDIISMWYSKN